MKPAASSDFTRRPERISGPENLKHRPQWWRAACASLSLAVLALCCATSARAQINWIDTDLGGPVAAGYTITNNDGTLEILGGGGDIWNNTSQCHYRYAWASGTTWDVTMQVQNFQGVDTTWSKVELMVDWADTKLGPQGSDAFIANMLTLPTGDNEFGVDQFRTVSGGAADWKQVGTSPHPVFPNAWMRIHRNGSIFSIYYSTDNVTWTDYLDIDTSKTTVIGGSGTTFGTAWPDLVCVGVAVTGHDDIDSLADATIANLTGTFSVITAPTVVNPTVQVSNTTAVAGCEASFSFATTNNSNPNVVLPTYQWYKNSQLVTNATGTSFTWLAQTADNGAQVYCVATVPAPYNTSVTTVTSATGTLTVTPGIIITNGWKTAIYSGGGGFSYIQAVEAGNTTPATTTFAQTDGDNPGGYGNNYVSRTSGFFIPPTTDHYVFFVDADDSADLLLNTNTANGTDPAGKVVIAQQTSWGPLDNWLATDTNGVAGGGNPPDYNQNRSDTYVTNGVNPGAGGYLLNAGQLYYLELVHSQGVGGDNFGVTYQTIAQVNANSLTNGQPSLIAATKHNMAFISYPDTTPTWTLQPTNINVTLGNAGGFAVNATDGGEFAPNYQWYSNSVPVPGATTASLYYGNVPASADGAQYFAVATAVVSGLSSTSSIVTLHVAPAVLERGWTKVEYWYGFDSKTSVTNGTAPAPDHVITSPSFEAASSDSAGAGNDYVNRLTTLFYPPTTGTYDFFVNSDDQSDLFVSTDATPGNKRLVAQEGGWANAWQWQGANGASTVAQKASSTWSPDGTTTPWASGISMTAGQPYYIEMDHQDTGGGNNAEATFTLHGAGTPSNGTHSALTGNLIAINVPRSYALGFVQEPTNATPALDGVVTFTVAGTTDSQIAVGTTGDPRPLWTNTIVYQWTRNGTAIPGANGSSYSFGPVTPQDNGVQYVCQIRSLGLVNDSQVDIWSNSLPATITVAGSPVFETGYALHQYWGSNPGRTVIENNNAGAPDWSMSTPAFEADITGTEVADNFCDELLGFFIPPTTGQYVFFCNSDDDADLFLSTNNSFADSVLIAQQTSYSTGALKWSSTANGTATQVRSDTFVDAFGNTPFATGIPLVAGQKYAMQIVHHQGGGGTYSCVTAKLVTDPDPVDGTPSTIRGGELGTYVPPCTYVTITNQPQSITANNYTSASFSITAGTDSTLPIGPEGDWRNSFNNFLAYQWFMNGAPITGANSATYSIPTLLPDDNNAQLYCITRALGYADASGNPLWVTSSVVKVTVLTNAPQMTYAAFYANSNYTNFISGITGLPFNATNYIIIAFSVPMDPVMLGQASTYTLGGGLQILSILVNTNDYKSVALAVSGTITLPLNVQVSSSLAGMGGGLALGTNNAAALATVPLTDVDIGNPGTDPAFPGMMYVEGPNAYTIACEGSDIYNAADGFNFAYETKTNDFDVVVRQRDIKHTSDWAKGGLMVRETLAAGSRDWNIVNDPVSSDGINAPDGSGFGANAVECNTRNTTGGSSGGWNFNSSPVPAYPNAWVRLKRAGNLLSAFYSTNGTSWTLQATNDPTTVGDMTALPAVVYVGICTTAHNNDALGTDPTQLLYLNIADYDNYNSSYVYVAGTPVLTAKVVGNQLNITWTPNVGHLVASPALTGPNVNWQSVTGGTGGSVSVPISGSAMFFKVSNP
jgi:hypothetical protein